MKSAEIQVGVEYAYADYLPRNSPVTAAGLLHKVTVVEAPVGGEVAVQHPNGLSSRVRVQKIIRTWAENKALSRAERADQAQRMETQDEAAQRLNGARERLVGLLGDENLPWWARSDRPAARVLSDFRIHGLSSTGVFTVVDLEEVVQAAYAAGLEAGLKQGDRT